MANGTQPIEVGDVVTIHNGTTTWDVTQVSYLDEPGYAKVWPTDLDDEREGRWVNVELLHKQPKQG